MLESLMNSIRLNILSENNVVTDLMRCEIHQLLCIQNFEHEQESDKSFMPHKQISGQLCIFHQW